MKMPKELISLAGEYAVASELCRRGVYAQLTLGHHKRTDLLVESEYQFIRIQVKAKQGTEWPSISGIYTSDDFLVLVDFAVGEGSQPDYYVLNLEDWKNLIQLEKERRPQVQVDEKLTIRYPDGWKGLNIRPAMVSQYKECWKKIIEKMGLTRASSQPGEAGRLKRNISK